MTSDLIDRFRAGSLERIRLAKLALADLEEGHADAKILKRIVGELHTLKGESRMLGLSAVSRLAHAIEECLAPAVQQGVVSREVSLASRGALETIARSLRGELGPEPLNTEALTTALEDLNIVTEALDDSSDGPTESAEPSRKGNGEALLPLSAQERWAQIKTSHVDELCERMHEFTATFGQLHSQIRSLVKSFSPSSLRLALEEFERCQAKLDELGSSAWALRLVPVEPTLGQLVEHARDLALIQEKRVRVTLSAGGAQVERGILDDLWEPLLHLVRNAIDHGVESADDRGDKPAQATVHLSAHAEGANVVVSVADDGRGIDPDEVRRAAIARGAMSQAAAEGLSDEECSQLLFDHGFTTRRTVTEVSGRGIGLDVVRRKVEALGGSIKLSTAVGQGTTFTLRVPASISRDRLLVFALSETLFAVPSRATIAVVSIDPAHLRDVAGGRVITYLDESFPLQSLAATLGLETEDSEPYAILLDLFGHRRAYSVKTLLGEHELLRRPVDAALAAMGIVAGSATLDDGRLILLLQMETLLGRVRARPRPRPAASGPRRRRVLVVDDSPIVRELIAEMLDGVGVAVDAVEDGVAALRAMETTWPDLVLSDVEMPRMDGLELLRRIRGKNQQVPVVMLTTRGSTQDRRIAAELGANAYLVKSDFEGTKLIDTVSRFINLKS